MAPDDLGLLRDVLQEHAPLGSPPVDRVASVYARARRRRRSQLGALVAVVVVVGVVVGTAGVQSSASRSTGPAGPQATSPAPVATQSPSAPAPRVTSPEPDRTGVVDDLVGPTWVLSEVRIPGANPSAGRAALHAPNEFFLSFTADGAYSGSDGCNGIGGTYRLVGGVLTLHGDITSYAACDFETTTVFHQVTSGPMSVTMGGPGLELMAPDKRSLGFRPKS